MPFDLSAVTAQASKVAQSNENGEGQRDFKYKLLYPGSVGTLQVKLLFNPKTNMVSRLVNNHKINNVNIPCMRTWEQDCPICAALREIKNATGDDHPQLRSVTRAISLAQPVNDNYPLPDGVHAGDIVLLMYPWTVYKDIQQIINQAHSPQELTMLVASNEGMVFNITHGPDNRYSTQIDPFARYKTCQTDEEFEVLLNGLDSLDELYRPSSPTEEQMNTIGQAADELRKTFLRPNMAPQGQGAPAVQQQTSFYTGGGMQGQPQVQPQPNQWGGQQSPMPNVGPGTFQPQAQAPSPQQPRVGYQTQFGQPSPTGDPDIPFSTGATAPAQQQPVTPAPSAAPSPAAQMGFQVPAGNTGFQSPMNSVVTAPAPTATPAPAQTVPAPATPAPAATAPTDTMSGLKPECFSHHGDPNINPDQCAICGFEFECLEKSPA